MTPDQLGVLQWTAEAAIDKQCHKCNVKIINELKADPFFTGIYTCPDCKARRQTSPKKLPNLHVIAGSFIGESSRPNDHFPSPIPTPTPSPLPLPSDNRNRLSFYLSQMSPQATPKAMPTPALSPRPSPEFRDQYKPFSGEDVTRSRPMASARPISHVHYSSQSGRNYQPIAPAKKEPRPGHPISFESFVMKKETMVSSDRGLDKAYITQYELCKNCHGLNTSGVVVTDKGEKMCRKCFKAATVSSKGATSRVCNKCRTSQTSKWYTDRLAVGHICKSCYTKRRSSPHFDGIEGQRICTRCSVSESTLWYQDHFTANGYMCMTCHDARKKPRNK
jgi:hypothetical protein